MTHLYNIDIRPCLFFERRFPGGQKPKWKPKLSLSNYFGCKIFTIQIQISIISLWINSIFISDMMDTCITPEHSILPYSPSIYLVCTVLGRHLPLATCHFVRKRRKRMRKKKKEKRKGTDGRTG